MKATVNYTLQANSNSCTMSFTAFSQLTVDPYNKPGKIRKWNTFNNEHQNNLNLL